MKPALVVLAAGASRRLGTCKATVLLDGRPAIQHLLVAARGLDSYPALVVVGADADRIRVCLPADVDCLENPDWSAGRTGGAALAARARAGADLVIAPVDCPLVPARVFNALSREWERVGAPARGWLAPRHPSPPGPDRHGHPIVLGRELAERLPSLFPGNPLRELRREADPLLSLAVGAPEILDRLTRPEDLQRLQQRF